LQLSLVLVEVAALQSAAEDLEKALRRELRGSDVLGALNGHRVAALLTHTDAEGLQYVVRRLRQKLADAAGTLQWSSVLLGQAAFSPDCRTANALVSRALRDAEPIVVH
jgi:GGDEF domain-containing protein